jgi:hypothetical protein
VLGGIAAVGEAVALGRNTAVGVRVGRGGRVLVAVGVRVGRGLRVAVLVGDGVAVSAAVGVPVALGKVIGVGVGVPVTVGVGTTTKTVNWLPTVPEGV